MSFRGCSSLVSSNSLINYISPSVNPGSSLACAVGSRVPLNLYQEIMKLREVIPHIGPIPIVIPLRLFLDDVNFPADNVTARVTWKFRGGEKVRQILYDVILCFKNWVSWPDKIHCLQDTGFKHISLELLNCLVYNDTKTKFCRLQNSFLSRYSLQSYIMEIG